MIICVGTARTDCFLWNRSRIKTILGETCGRTCGLSVSHLCRCNQKAYWAAIYVRLCNSDGKFHSDLVTSKTKVAPVQEITLPRLESWCLGALIADKLWLRSEFRLVLHWIKNNSRKLKMFVRNRIDEIRKISYPDSWNHCPRNENLADTLPWGKNWTSLNDQERRNYGGLGHHG